MAELRGGQRDPHALEGPVNEVLGVLAGCKKKSMVFDPVPHHRSMPRVLDVQRFPGPLVSFDDGTTEKFEAETGVMGEALQEQGALLTAALGNPRTAVAWQIQHPALVA